MGSRSGDLYLGPMGIFLVFVLVKAAPMDWTSVVTSSKVAKGRRM